MQDCHKWAKCSAPICPLDHEWSLRKYIRDESICFYMREFFKKDSFERFKKIGGVEKEIYDLIAQEQFELLSLSTPLKNRLQHISTTPSLWCRTIGNTGIYIK